MPRVAEAAWQQQRQCRQQRQPFTSPTWRLLGVSGEMGCGRLVSMSRATKVKSAVSCSCPACSSSMRMSTLLLPVHTTRPVICSRAQAQQTQVMQAVPPAVGRGRTCCCMARYAVLRCAVLCLPPTHPPTHLPTHPPTHPHVLLQVELAAAQLNCLHPCGHHQRWAAGLVRNVAAGARAGQAGRQAGSQM